MRLYSRHALRVDSSERARAGYLPDKLRYAPWSGAPMEGSMEVTADRCEITLTRSTGQKMPHAGILCLLHWHEYPR